MSNELVIKISGDVKNFQDALDKAKAKTEDLSGALNTTAKYSAVAFAALTAEIGFAVHAFAEGEAAVNKLTAALQNQGIYSSQLVESYKSQAQAAQELTGASDDELISAQATIQSHLGQIAVTQELTMAIADLAAAKGISLTGAADLLGRAVDGNTKLLKQYGIEVQDTGSKQENLARIMTIVQGNFGGLSQAGAQGLGVFKLIAANFGDLQKAIGEKFAPIITMAGEQFNKFLLYLKDNKEIVTWIARVLAFGAAFTGIITVVATAVAGFLAFSAVIAAGGGALVLLMGPIGIITAAIVGLSLAVGALAGNWNKVWPVMYASAQAFAVGIGAMFSGIAEIFSGLINRNLEQVKNGWAQIRNAGEEGADAYFQALDEKTAEHEAKEEAAAIAKAEANKQKKLTAAEIDKEDRRKAVEDLLAENEEYQAMTEEQQAIFREKELAQLQQNIITDKNARGAVASDTIAEQLKLQNDYQKNMIKYGKAVADIENSLNSEKVNRVRELSGNLIQMQNSENQTLKSIGKAAAITNITIDTARAAMSVFKGAIEAFGVPVGPIVGAVLAGATVAYGAEQIGKVTSAADGGLITGGIPGRDSVPAMLMPGEMVVPERNFQEVIDAMVMARGGDPSPTSEGVARDGGWAHVEISFKDQFMEFIEMKLIERRNLGISLQAT